MGNLHRNDRETRGTRADGGGKWWDSRDGVGVWYFGKNGLKRLKITGKVPERMQMSVAKGCEGLIYQQVDLLIESLFI